jgi:hypothetical protein
MKNHDSWKDTILKSLKVEIINLEVRNNSRTLFLTGYSYLTELGRTIRHQSRSWSKEGSWLHLRQ